MEQSNFGETLYFRLDPKTAAILDELSRKACRSKAMTVRYLIRAAGALAEINPGIPEDSGGHIEYERKA